MNSLGISIGIVIAALIIDIVVIRSDLNVTIAAIFLLCVSKSNDGFATLLHPKFWSFVFGAIAPWVSMVTVLLVMAKVAAFMPDVSSDARGGVVLFAVLPTIAGLVALVVGLLTAMFKLPEATIRDSFMLGLKIHNPIFLFQLWFS